MHTYKKILILPWYSICHQSLPVVYIVSLPSTISSQGIHLYKTKLTKLGRKHIFVLIRSWSHFGAIYIIKDRKRVNSGKYIKIFVGSLTDRGINIQFCGINREVCKKVVLSDTLCIHSNSSNR